MEHKKLIEDLLDDCNSLETLASYISLVPEMEQLHTHLISIKDRVLCYTILRQNIRFGCETTRLR